MFVLMCGRACVYTHIPEYVLASRPYDHSLSLGKSLNEIHQKNTKENVCFDRSFKKTNCRYYAIRI